VTDCCCKHVHLRLLRFSELQEQTREDVNANVFVTVVGLQFSAVEYDLLLLAAYGGGQTMTLMTLSLSNRLAYLW